MALRWFATAPIHFDLVRAFNIGDQVPDSIVAAHPAETSGRVTQIDVPAQNPGTVLRPLLTTDRDTDPEREAFVPSRLSDASLRAASVAANSLVTVTPPSGFALTAPVPYTVYRTATGRYVLDIDVDALRAPAGVTYYIAPTGGSGNSGLSPAAPTTLPAAIAKADNGDTIVCAPGEYFRNLHTAPTITKSLNIIGQPGAILTSFEATTTLTWTLQSGNIYQTTRSATQGVIDKRAAYVTAGGDYPVYAQKADLASITGPGQWAIVGTTVYVWALGNANLATDASFLRLNLQTGLTVLNVQGGNTLYVQGLQIEGGGSATTGAVGVDLATGSPARPRLIAVDTSVKYAVTKGFRYTGADLALFVRCTASSTGGDGFSGHAGTVNSVVIPSAGIEIDCAGLYNGQNNGTDETQNASTSHGGSAVLRINGTYRFSFGPPVDEDSGAKSWNLGCVAGSSRGPNRFWAYCASTSGAQMWLEDCAADPGATALYAYDATSAIHLRRPRTGSLMRMSSVSGPGVIDTY